LRRYIEEAELLAIVDAWIRHSFDSGLCEAADAVLSSRTDGSVRPNEVRGRGAGEEWGVAWDSVSSTGQSDPTPSDQAPAVFRVLLAEDSRANQVAISRLLRQGLTLAQISAQPEPVWSGSHSLSSF